MLSAPNNNKAVPNPGQPRTMRPVTLITDRAKRYRANASPPPGRRRCNFCSSTRNIDIDHVTGDESDGSARNLIYLCRSCNAAKGRQQSHANVGTRTRQYNPAPPVTLNRFLDSVLILRGDIPGDVAAATACVLASTPAQRLKFGDAIANARNPEQVPTFAQYARAVATHARGTHDEGGSIIHATPPGRRSEYARQIAALKRQHGTTSTRPAGEEVPF